MDNTFTKTAAPIILLLSLSLSLLVTTTVATVTGQELDAALLALRTRGYSLFPNAITTTDLRPLLLSLNSTFTLFSPPDSLVYSLDISCTAPLYFRSILHHVAPFRLSMSDLRSIRGSPYLDTLITSNPIFVDNSLVHDNGIVSESVLLDGVRVSVPDLFIGSSIAVHGLEGILVAEVGSNSNEHIDRLGDQPFVSPVASWSEQNSPASAPSAKVGLRGTSTLESMPKKRNGMRGQRTRNQRGFHGELSHENRHSNFAKYGHQFGARLRA